jgi:predicted Zn-dependent protease
MKLKNLCLLALTLSMVVSPINAQGLLRDAEIEKSLRHIAQPILNSAGLSGSSVNFFIVNDRSMNAFVAGGKNIFINYGLVTRMDSVEQLQAVLAHEIGHITGGHLAQRIAGASQARTAAGLGILLGAVVGAASGNAGAGAGVIVGTSSTATRKFLTHTRAQEASADQAGIRYMQNAGIHPKAALDVLKLFEGQNLMSAKRRDPYAQTHPLTQARMSSIRGFVAAYKPRPTKQAENAAYWYARMRAKFLGFTGNPKSVLRKVGKKDNSEVAIYTRAIAYHHRPDTKNAAREIKRLLTNWPNDPFYNELNGQFLLETGNAAGAVNAYRRAVQLAPKEAQILAGLGRALNAAGNYKSALKALKSAYAKDPRDGRMLRELAVAYAKNKQGGWASVVTAERYALQGNFKLAATHATRAQSLLPSGSTGWLKAQDIIGYAKKIAPKKKR